MCTYKSYEYVSDQTWSQSGVESRPKTVSFDSQSTQTEVQLPQDNCTQAESPPTSTSTQTVEADDNADENHDEDDVMTGGPCLNLPAKECSLDTLPIPSR